MRLSESTFPSDPLRQFQSWFNRAVRAGLHQPEAMTLATATRAGRPSARMVLLKSADQRGFTFFTNYGSRKGRELAANPHAGLVFYWPELGRQVRITGRVSKLPAAESDTYFATRAPGSRISATVSRQSSVVASRAILEERHALLAEKNPAGGPPRPKNWGGYCVQPDEIEFWQQAPDRLHDRLRYRRRRDGSWKLDRLYP